MIERWKDRKKERKKETQNERKEKIEIAVSHINISSLKVKKHFLAHAATLRQELAADVSYL